MTAPHPAPPGPRTAPPRDPGFPRADPGFPVGDGVTAAVYEIPAEQPEADGTLAGPRPPW